MIRKFKHLNTGIIGTNDSELDYFLHFERGDDTLVEKESIISMEFVEDSNDWEEVKRKNLVKPTKWFETKQIETWIGLTENGENPPEIQGGRAKLIILHQCGEHKDDLISQLKTMIYNIETNGEDFASQLFTTDEYMESCTELN